MLEKVISLCNSLLCMLMLLVTMRVKFFIKKLMLLCCFFIAVITVSGCNSSYLNDRNRIDLEPGRCRRTDGKKWRCKSAVLPGQKYCATHMHRGAKRRFADHEPVTTTSAVTDTRLPYSAVTTTTNIQKAYGTIPNTSLSMSIPASAPLTQHNEKSPSCSSDTDTTITDTINEYSYASF